MRQLEPRAGMAPLSVIGFGCASLGSRVGTREAVAALERAFEAGINWYDVAPSYGDGHAEAILGEFIRGRRHAVNICTKVGIAADPTGWKAAIRPLARKLVSAFPAMRKYATRSRTVTKLPLSPEGIKISVERSLKRLGVERIDMLMLHDPVATDVVRDDIAEALTRLISSGKVMAVGVAGDMAAARNGATRPELFSAIQIANNPMEPNAGADFVEAWRALGKLVITHSALGAYGALPALTALIGKDPAVRSELAAAGYTGEAAKAAADFLTAYALAANPDGICLFSATRPRHLDALVAQAMQVPDRGRLAILAHRAPTILELSDA